jgi:uncharacterized membrane protein HdeD (DUF308 family)
MGRSSLLVPDGVSLTSFAHARGVLACRGLCGVGFGAVAALPVVTLALLVPLFAAFLLIDGALATAAAVQSARRRAPWGALALEGMLGIAAAWAVIALPTHSVLVLVYVAGLWAFLSGTCLLAVSTHFGMDGWLLALAAAASILLGCLLLFAPERGAVLIAPWLGFYAIISGLIFLGLSWRLRRLSGSCLAS